MKSSRALALCGLVLFSSCFKSVDKQARDQVRTLDSARLDEKAVEVVDLKESGEFAVAEIRIKTAAKLRKQGNEWILEEVRIGDRRWERVDRILAALDESRSREAERQLNLVREGIRLYAAAEGRLPAPQSFEKLTDMLTPEYVPEVVRDDPWWRSYEYRVHGPGDFEVRSAGPDGELDTPDDLSSRSTESHK